MSEQYDISNWKESSALTGLSIRISTVTRSALHPVASATHTMSGTVGSAVGVGVAVSVGLLVGGNVGVAVGFALGLEVGVAVGGQ